MRKNIHPGLVLGVVALALVTAAVPGSLAAAPGDLDPSFGNGGKVTTDFGDLEDAASAVALQPNGKLVAVGGTFTSGAVSDFALARYNPDGSLDGSFGSGGKVTTSFGGADSASAIAVQPDGKLVAAGTGGTGPFGTADFALARYNVDGSLDASFGSGGKVSTDFGGLDAAGAVAIQPDGKLVAAGIGVAGRPGTGNFALARYNADGSLDASFGSGGKVVTDFGGGPFSAEGAGDVAIRSDGRIVAVGAVSISGAGLHVVDFALARYNAAGSLDSSFGSGGKVLTDFGGGDDRAGGAVLQSDGKIVAAGTTSAAGVSDFALARYNADGSLDASFGSGGKVTTAFGPLFGEGASDVALQSDEKLIAAGGTGQTGGDFALARYKPDGTLDASFGSGGKVTTDFGASDAARGVAVQADGKIVAAGSTFFTTGGDFALARYQGQGARAVSIDIKPGSSTNPINLSSKGVVPVAILTTDGFDASTVDPSTVCFGDDDNPGQRNCAEAHHRGHSEDVNGDGRPDLLLHYEVGGTGIDRGDTSACLTGSTFTGLAIEGCDTIETLK